jgi:hypothetical protein
MRVISSQRRNIDIEDAEACLFACLKEKVKLFLKDALLSFSYFFKASRLLLEKVILHSQYDISNHRLLQSA